MTIAELFSEWHRSILHRVKESTAANYTMKADKHILPAFGQIAVCNLTANHIYDFIAEKQKAGFSPRYIADIIVLMKTVFKYAVRTYQIINPLEGIVLPKKKSPEIRLLDEAEQKTLQQYIGTHQNRSTMGTALSISENVTWGQRKRMADGKVSLPYSRFLGYRKGENDIPEIVPEEAEIVRFIYRSFMEGLTANKIAKLLMEQNTPAPGGGKKWYARTIESILTNEKYKGSALLQKKFTVDFLTKKQKINEGEVPQYFVEDSHPPIIDPEEFALVQAEITRRKTIGKVYSSSNIFSTKIICSCCGGYFGSKVWHSTSKYRRVVWQCNHKFQNGEKCSTPHLYENTLREKFVIACGKICENKADFLDSCQQIRDMLSDCTALDEKIHEQYVHLNELAAAMQKFIQENALHPQSEDFYNQKMAAYERQKSEGEKILRNLQSKKASRLSRKDLLGGMIHQLTEQDMTITAFDKKLWRIMVENVTVKPDGNLTFLFRNGTKIEV